MQRQSFLVPVTAFFIIAFVLLSGCSAPESRRGDTGADGSGQVTVTTVATPAHTPVPEKTAVARQYASFTDLGVSMKYPAGLSPIYAPDRNYSLIDETITLPEARFRAVSFEDPATHHTLMGVDWISLTMEAANKQHLQDLLDNQVLYPGISRIVEGRQVAERKQGKESGRDVLSYAVWNYVNNTKYEEMHYFFVNLTSGRNAVLHHLFFVVSDDDPFVLSHEEYKSLLDSVTFSRSPYGETI